MHNTTEYFINDTPLSRVHTVLLDLLNEVDRICKKNKIDYFLSGGTLLGAIRHGGFIPWDDDLDIWMTRDNYSRFKKSLKKDLNTNKFDYEDYFSNLHFPLSILKIKRKDTIFVEKTFSHLDIKHYIYIDIFPLDKVVKPFFKLQTKLLIRYQAMRLFKLDNDKNKYKLAKRCLYGILPLCILRGLTEITIRFFNWTTSKHYAQLCHRPRYWPIFSKDQITSLVYVKFENGSYPVPRQFDIILKECYGDYLKIPTKSEQHPSHDVIECKILFKETIK